MPQSTNTLLMIRPVSFTFNEETADTNAFQQSESKREDAQDRALKEFNSLVKMLRDRGVQVITIDDTPEPHTPDSIFPNNWISTHQNGLVVVYPMQAQNRRLERRADIVSALAENFKIDDIIDYSAAEQSGKFLEGTGSMVLDRENRICYACLSPRTNPELLEAFCHRLNYEAVMFDALDGTGLPIYHTNVVMCVATNFIVVCMDAIQDAKQRQLLIDKSTKPVIQISLDQMNHFAGNMLEVIGKNEELLLVMSERAYKSLLPEQITEIEKYNSILYAPLYTIEDHGGGSARCMLTEIFLPLKTKGIN